MSAWTDSGKPIPHPSGKVSPCILCGKPATDTWDGLAMCGTCEGEMAASLRTETCKHCGRSIELDGDVWVDPHATGDDSLWRETCDAHDTFVADHEPADAQRHCVDCGEPFEPVTESQRRCKWCNAAKHGF